MESVKQVDVIKRLEKLEEEKKELENSLVLFKKIYKTATDPMLLIDKNSKIVDANPASFLFFQLPREELLKKTINDFILLDGDETIKNHQEILIKNGTLLDEVSLSVIDGTVKNVVIHVIGNIRNNVDLYILKDISPIRNLEYERAMHLQMFNNIFSQVIDGLVLFDETGTIINANPAFCSVVNLEKEKLIGRKFHSLVPKIYEGAVALH